jgi:hypothetical protein
MQADAALAASPFQAAHTTTHASEALRLSVIRKTAASARNSDCVAEAKSVSRTSSVKIRINVVSEDRKNNWRLDYQHRRVSVG